MSCTRVKNIALLVLIALTLLAATAHAVPQLTLTKKIKGFEEQEDVDNTLSSLPRYTADANTQYVIVKKYTREQGQRYFTQGLSFMNENTLLESSGLYGRSEIHIMKFPELTITKRATLGTDFFGEGSVMVTIDGKRKLYLLTWRERKVFEYDDTMSLVREIALPQDISEGWGLTKYTREDGKKVLLVSDGSSYIFHVDVEDWSVLKKVEIRDNGTPIRNLNELEMYKDSLLANVWQTNTVLRIDPETGSLLAKYDMKDLENDVNSAGKYTNMNYVLNGIAYDKKADRLLLTGKMWPCIFEIKLIENN